MRAAAGRWSLAPDDVENERRVPMPWIMAALPLLTMGFGAAAPFFYAGVRTGRRRFTLLAVLYLALIVAWVAYMGSGREDVWHALTGLGALVALACLSTAHAFALRRPSGWGAALVGLRPRDPLTLGRDRVERRQRARRIVRDDPELADELRIGRPDLRRYFDDGGLVDLNHVPASVLSSLPDVGPALAAEIVTAREGLGRFDSVDDLSTLLDVSPRLVDRLRDVVICRP